MRSYSEISTRYMKENKKRTTLTIMGIALATILIFAIGTFLLSFKDSMLQNLLRIGGEYEFKINDINSTEVEKLINNAEVKSNAILMGEAKEYKTKATGAEAWVYAGDKNYYEKIYTNEIIEGVKPAKENEIIVDTYTRNALKIKLGEEITLEDKNGQEDIFKVVGVTEPQGYFGGYNIYSYFDRSKLNSDSNYSVYINLNSKKDKQEIINKVLSDANIELEDYTKEDNSQVLYLTGNGGNEHVSAGIMNIAIFVIAIIIICTITVIYNSFNISVIERTKYFGILKAVGTTPRQIKTIIYKEGYLMGLIALPIGCIIGFLSLKYGIKIFIGNSIMMMENFKVGFYPSIILITAAIVIVTIYISLLGPAHKAKKVSAVDAMRNKNDIKLGKIKKRKSTIITKVFGIEGSIAYKNIRRTPFRFIVTVIALIISVVMFNVFYGFMDFAKQTVMQQFLYCEFDAQLNNIDTSKSFSKEELNEIQAQNPKGTIYQYYLKNESVKLPTEYINSEYEKKTGYLDLSDNSRFQDIGYTDIRGNGYYIGGTKELRQVEKYITEGRFDEEALKNGGIILVDGTKITTEEGKREIVRRTTYKVGDTIKIPKVKVEEGTEILSEPSEEKIEEAIKNNQFYELPIIAIADREPIMGQYGDNKINLLIHEEAYKKDMGEFDPNTIFFSFNGDTKAREKAIEYFQDISNTSNYKYMDIGDSLKEVEDLYKQVQFFVYCFIIVISIISIVNIFNTISTNLLLRKKEFSTLKAIGMTEKQLRRSVLLEGTLYGIIAAIVGGILSALLLALMIKTGGGVADVKYNFAAVPFILSIICAIGVTYISTLVPLRRLKNLTIVEGISDDE